MEYHERPGVYVEYDLSGISAGSKGQKTVAFAVRGTGEEILTCTSAETAAKLVGDNPVGEHMVRIILECGAGSVLLCPVAGADAEAYSTAVNRLLAQKKAGILVLDTQEISVLEPLGELLQESAERGSPCIAVVGQSDVQVSELLTAAETLNSQRVVLVGGTGKYAGDDTPSGCYSAAAVAGLLAGETDPALPISGGELVGLSGIAEQWSETEIDQMIRGGVTPLEAVGTTVSPVRGVTTKQSEQGTSTGLWRELEVVRIVDDVIPGVRDELKSRFARKKNNEATRGAIRSAVAMVLENRVRREIIDRYGEITATVNEADPSVCDVCFSFAVVHGLGRIFLSAHITV